MKAATVARATRPEGRNRAAHRQSPRPSGARGQESCTGSSLGKPVLGRRRAGARSAVPAWGGRVHLCPCAERPLRSCHSGSLIMLAKEAADLGRSKVKVAVPSAPTLGGLSADGGLRGLRGSCQACGQGLLTEASGLGVGDLLTVPPVGLQDFEGDLGARPWMEMFPITPPKPMEGHQCPQCSRSSTRSRLASNPQAALRRDAQVPTGFSREGPRSRRSLK